MWETPVILGRASCARAMQTLTIRLANTASESREIRHRDRCIRLGPALGVLDWTWCGTRYHRAKILNRAGQNLRTATSPGPLPASTCACAAPAGSTRPSAWPAAGLQHHAAMGNGAKGAA